MTSHSDNDTATAKKLADMFLADFDNLVANSRPSTAVPGPRIRTEKPGIDTYGQRSLDDNFIRRRRSLAGEVPGFSSSSAMGSSSELGYNLHESTVNLTSQELNLERSRGSQDIKPVTEGRARPNIQFNMDNIVRQIKDDIIERCRKICEKATLLKYEERQGHAMKLLSCLTKYA